MRYLIAAALAVALSATPVEGKTHTRNVGFWIKQGNQTTVVLYPTRPVRQTVIYQTNVIQPTCRPVAQKAPRATYKPSKYTPPLN